MKVKYALRGVSSISIKAALAIQYKRNEIWEREKTIRLGVLKNNLNMLQRMKAKLEKDPNPWVGMVDILYKI